MWRLHNCCQGRKRSNPSSPRVRDSFIVLLSLRPSRRTLMRTETKNWRIPCPCCPHVSIEAYTVKVLDGNSCTEKLEIQCGSDTIRWTWSSKWRFHLWCKKEAFYMPEPMTRVKWGGEDAISCRSPFSFSLFLLTDINFSEYRALRLTAAGLRAGTGRPPKLREWWTDVWITITGRQHLNCNP